jgi:YVTN family beta-propeller protein
LRSRRDDSGAVTFAYVSNIGDSSITPVTPEREALLNVSGVGAAPHGLDYGRGTHAIYNCSGDAMHSVEVVATRDDPETALNEQHTIVARIPLEERCRYIHVSDDGMFAHATSPKSNRFVRINLMTHAVTTFETGGAPDTFEIVGGYAYVGNVSDPYVSVVDLMGSASPAQIAVGNAVPPNEDEDGTRAMRLDGGHLFVANAYDGTVSVIDVTSNLVIATLTDIPGAAGIAIAGPEGGTTFPR